MCVPGNPTAVLLHGGDDEKCRRLLGDGDETGARIGCDHELCVFDLADCKPVVKEDAMLGAKEAPAKETSLVQSSAFYHCCFERLAVVVLWTVATVVARWELRM